MNSRMNLMWHTLGIAVWDIAAFFTIFLMVFFGYTVMAFLAFGQVVSVCGCGWLCGCGCVWLWLGCVCGCV